MIFVTSCRRDYPKAWLFDSLRLLPDRTFAILDPGDDRPLPANVTRVSRTINRCYQDGRFLDALPGDVDADEVVVLLDADAVVQRPPDDRELEPADGGFALGWNMHSWQRGEDELKLLMPQLSLKEMALALDSQPYLLNECGVFNWGLASATASTWQRLREMYRVRVGDRGPRLFGPTAWMQYLLCLTLGMAKVPIRPLGFRTHAHGHFGTPAGCEVRDGRLWCGNELVLYAHNFPEVAGQPG